MTATLTVPEAPAGPAVDVKRPRREGGRPGWIVYAILAAVAAGSLFPF